MAEEKEVEKGIVLYTIEAGGCLNGLYTNENANGVLISESLKKLDSDYLKIEGDYSLHYFDHENQSYFGKVKVSKAIVDEVLTDTYDFVWTVNGDKEPRFKGIGYKMNATQIAVTYWSNLPDKKTINR